MHLSLFPSLSRASRVASLRAPLRRCTLKRPLTTAASRACTKCGAALPTALPLCTACKFIAPVQPHTTSRDVLAQHVEPGENPFRVDPQALRAAFLRAQQVCHPDAWASAPVQSQRLAGEYSALINHAYRTLSSPLARAEEILRDHGRDTKEHDQLDDPELVMGIMETRERIEEGNEAVREEITRTNKEHMKACVARLEEHIANEDWDAAKKEATKLNYLETIDAAARGIDHH
ncbi:Co-chaperone Hsc20 [Auriculariales sp. MPI-PUGE-AT-0066]|nr:Co-chaperone Hsc20 [Auriculariales sp. MPI-PUGE-AT-0066]